jgi:hypothetical protein
MSLLSSCAVSELSGSSSALFASCRQPRWKRTEHPALRTGRRPVARPHDGTEARRSRSLSREVASDVSRAAATEWTRGVTPSDSVRDMYQRYTWPFGTSTTGRHEHDPKKHDTSTARHDVDSASARHGTT